MSLIKGETATVILTPTLAGNPGTFEGTPVISVIPPEAGTVDMTDGIKIVWAQSGEATIKAIVDNVQGDIVGTLEGLATVTITEPAQVLTADALGVSVS